MHKSQNQYVALRQDTHPVPVVGKRRQGIHATEVSLLRERVEEPNDGFLQSMKPNAPPASKKIVPEFVLPTTENALPVPQNNSVDFNKSRKRSTSSAEESETTRSSLETPEEASPPPKQNTRETVKPFLSYQDAGSALYGDAVHFLTGLGVVPVCLHDFYQVELDDPDRAACAIVVVALLSGPIFGILAISTKNLWLSRLAMAGGLAFSALSNELVDWPHEGECTITALFHGGILMCVMANVSLSFEEKIVRLLVFFIVGSYVSIQSPYSVYLEDTLPLLGGTTLMSIFVLYICHFGFCLDIATVQGARLILGGLMVRHAVISATSSEYTMSENIMSLVRGAFVVAVGIAAAGTVQDEMLQKERLEVLVRKRTQNLHMVNLALQASETAIAIIDNWGAIIWVNTAFERISGKKEQGLLGLMLKDTIYNLDTSSKENKYLLMESYDDPSKVSERELTIGESVFHLESTPFSSERYGKDRLVQNDRFLMVFKDITATRAREVAEKKAQQEAMLAKAMGESMVTLTHELRTPLQGIMGVTSLLLQQASDLTKDAVESLKLIMASSTLLLNLINNLLDVKKANAKMMETFPLMSISASEQIKDAVCFCQPLAFISNVNLITDMRTDKNPIVSSNALRLQQVLINLVSNAIKYTRRGSDIRIQIRSASLGKVRRMIDSAIASSYNANDKNHSDDTAVLVFSVSDCGPGIAPDQASRLFEQYAQLESRPIRTLGSNAVGQPSGTGVGLHLCQLFVNRMNGQIWATNNGRGVDGSTFSFYLPLVSCATCHSVLDPPIPNRVSTSRSSSSNDKQVNRGERQGKGSSLFDYRVLVVDDVLINRKVFDRMIKKVGISKSVTVDSGRNALDELSRNRYDVVITDLQMPGMSGTDLCAAIRDSNTLSYKPIVVGLTADISGDAVKRCVESGMADLLYKPITLSEMKDYFETTIPKLQPGIWYKSATSASYNDAGISTDGTAAGREKNGGSATPAQ